MAKATPNVWKLETLVSNAFKQSKERFLSYLFVYIIGVLITVTAAVVIALSAGFLFLLSKTVNLLILTIFLGAILAIAVIAALLYFGSWIQLAILSVITNKQKISVSESLVKTRPIVPGFIIVNVLSGLFILGLLPFGVLSLLTIFFLWGIWGAFTGLVYLYQKQPKGLDSLWLSKQMVDQNFWGIVGRIVLVWAVIYFFIFLFTFSKNSFLGSLSPIISIIVTPFIIAFIYEIYKNLSVPKSIKLPSVWVTLSVIGWIILLVIIVVLGGVLAVLWGQIIPRNLQF